MKLFLVLASIVLVPGSATAQEYAVHADKFPSGSLVEQFRLPAGASAPAGARSLNLLAFELIKNFEGWIPAAYNDAVNYCTIGYGHLIALRRCQDTNLSAFGNKLSEADGSKLLEEDTRAARAAVQTLVSVALSDYGYDASDTILLERKDDMRKRGLTARRAATNA